MLIYKLLRHDEWAELEAKGESDGSSIDRADGYIHFSTHSQVKETAELHFDGVKGLWLVGFDTADMGGALKWESSRGGQQFPHYYGKLRRDRVKFAHELEMTGDAHIFPDLEDD